MWRSWLLAAALILGTAGPLWAPHCVRGKPCGNSCISVDKTCHIDDAPSYAPRPSYTPPQTTEGGNGLQGQSLYAPGQVIVGSVSNEQLIFATQMLLNALGLLNDNPSRSMTRAATTAIGRFQIEKRMKATGIASGQLLVYLSEEVMRRHGSGVAELADEPGAPLFRTPSATQRSAREREKEEGQRAERAAAAVKEQNAQRTAAVVRAWYSESYSPAMVVFRAAAGDFGAALTSPDAEKRARYADSCAALSTSISPARRGVGRSRVAKLDEALAEVFSAYSKMAQHCSQGHDREAVAAMAAAKASFAYLQFELGKYRLTP
jgi:hypothetical protein